MKTLILISLLLAGCGKGGGAKEAAALEPTNPVISPIVLPTTTTLIPAPVIVTYYSKSITEVIWGARSYTATGFCTVINSKTYCWDDGVKTVLAPVLPQYFTFWGRTTSSGGVCHGGCSTSDVMLEPIEMTPSITLNLTQVKINSVLAGTPIDATCSESSGILDCVDFQVDTN